MGLAPVEIERARHLLGRLALVAGGRIVEAAGVGGDRPAVQPRHQGGDRRAVDAAGQEQAVGHVRALVHLDAVLQHRVQPLQRLGLGDGRGRMGAGDEGGGVDLHAHGLARGQAAHALEDRAGPERVVQRQQLLGPLAHHHRLGVGQKGAGLRREGQPLAPIADVQRLDPERVARQRLGSVGQQAQGVHAAQLGQGLRSHPAPQVQQRLEVRTGVQAGQAVLGDQFEVVVDFAVADHRGAGGVQRLPAALQVDDRQPRVGEGEAGAGLGADAVGTAVGDGLDHPPHPAFVRRTTQHAGDPAHRPISPRSGRTVRATAPPPAGRRTRR